MRDVHSDDVCMTLSPFYSLYSMEAGIMRTCMENDG